MEGITHATRKIFSSVLLIVNIVIIVGVRDVVRHKVQIFTVEDITTVNTQRLISVRKELQENMTTL